MYSDSDIDYLIALYDQQYPDEVDLFEDMLTQLLGVKRHPATPLSQWRTLRVRAIWAAGDEADRLAPEVERYVDLETTSSLISNLEMPPQKAPHNLCLACAPLESSLP